MARVKFTAIVSEIRGSLGGNTFQANRYGFTLKNKSLQGFPNSLLQNFSKASLTQILQGWQNLTDAQRAQYNTYASSFPQYPKSGSTVALSGFEVWAKFNLQMACVGIAASPNAVLAPVVVPSYNPSLVTSGGLLSLYLGLSEHLDGHNVLIRASQRMWNTTNPSSAQWRVMKTAVSGPTPISLSDEYFAKFSSYPRVNDTIWISLSEWQEETPRLMTPVKFMMSVGT